MKRIITAGHTALIMAFFATTIATSLAFHAQAGRVSWSWRMTESLEEATGFDMDHTYVYFIYDNPGGDVNGLLDAVYYKTFDPSQGNANLVTYKDQLIGFWTGHEVNNAPMDGGGVKRFISEDRDYFLLPYEKEEYDPLEGLIKIQEPIYYQVYLLVVAYDPENGTYDHYYSTTVQDAASIESGTAYTTASYIFEKQTFAISYAMNYYSPYNPLPEPTTCVLAGLGTAILLLRRRRR